MIQYPRALTDSPFDFHGFHVAFAYCGKEEPKRGCDESLCLGSTTPQGYVHFQPEVKIRLCRIFIVANRVQ